MKSYSEYESQIGRHFSTITEYDQRGNWLSRVLFDFQGKPYGITVYGYIDGFRASKSNEVSHDGDRFTDIAQKIDNPATQPPDKRYDLKYVYTYKDGQVSEMKMFLNDGSRSMRHVYDYSADTYSDTGFDPGNKINTKYVWRLDNRGREVQRTEIDVRNVYGGDKTLLITYQSFDSVGNWTERTFVQVSGTGEKQTKIPSYTEYRIITYY